MFLEILVPLGVLAVGWVILWFILYLNPMDK